MATVVGLLAGLVSAVIGVQPAAAVTVGPLDLGIVPHGFSAADIDGSLIAGVSSGRAAVYDISSGEPTMIDLGALDGGTWSRATAIRGTIVVGEAETGHAGGPRHAFAYDLAAADPHMIDLGTLGGTRSSADAVDGTIVVGSATTAGDANWHAFAFDLAAADPHMIDLGTLGGRSSSAAAVDGTVVVGTADTASFESHAFAYDLAAAAPAMVDLGTLGGWNSSATDVDDGIVVGSAELAEDESYRNMERAFAYDLDAAEPTMIDLGTLGEEASRAVAIDGDIVVGRSFTPDDIASRAFAYDLGADQPTMVAVGHTGPRFTYATDVDDGVVVGFSYFQGRTPLLAFAYDVTAPSPALIDLGSLGGVWSNAVAIDGGLVVGEADDADGSHHAALWSLAPPTSRLVPGSATVVEGDGWTTVELPVTLTAPSPLPVGATWRTTVVSGAPPGQADDFEDYLQASGSVMIPAGQTTGSVTISIMGDDVPEGDEYIVVAFANPANATMGGYWGFGFITIVDDDQPAVVPGTSTVDEGDSETTVAQVPVSLSSPSDVPVTVSWTTLHAPGAALVQADPASDYTATSGTLTFAPGQTSATVTIEINGDVLPEPDEHVLVSFHDPTNAKMGGLWGLGAVLVADDDA